jgi:hypothetical protein
MGGFGEGPQPEHEYRETFPGNTFDDLVRYVFSISDVAYDIGYGHAWLDHRADSWNRIGLNNPGELVDIIDDTMNFPDDQKLDLDGGREAYWNERYQLIVIVNPDDPDSGTAFIPTNGKRYFNELDD